MAKTITLSEEDIQYINSQKQSFQLNLDEFEYKHGASEQDCNSNPYWHSLKSALVVLNILTEKINDAS